MIWPVLERAEFVIDPFQELDRLRRATAAMKAQEWLQQVDAPAINLWMRDDGAVLEAELPGVEPNDLSVTVEGDTVKLEGRRRGQELKEGELYHRRERSGGPFSRLIRLPFEVESDRVTATYERGVLRLALPRKESSKPRKIAINS